MRKTVYIVWAQSKDGKVFCEDPTFDKEDAEIYRQSAEAFGHRAIVQRIPVVPPEEFVER